MCPRCGVYTWSGGLISQWIDHMTCVVSWAYRDSSASAVTLVARRPVCKVIRNVEDAPIVDCVYFDLLGSGKQPE
jgi:hypothetical protein